MSNTPDQHPSDVLAAEAAVGQPDPQPWRPLPPSPPPAVVATPVAAEGEDDEEAVDLSDAPGLWPLTKLPYRRRAQYLRRLDELAPRLAALQDMKKGEQVSAGRAADLYEALDVIDEALRMVAADPERYDAWPGREDESRLMALFGRYMEAGEPGNSAGSTTS